MEGATIPYNALIWDVPRGHANYLAQALQQPFLLPRDMDSIWRTKQPDLFMSLKRDLTMVSCSSLIQVFKISFFFFVMLIVFLIIFVISMQVTQQVYVVEDWVRNANNKLDIETQTWYDIEKFSAQRIMRKRRWLRSLRLQRVRTKALRLS